MEILTKQELDYILKKERWRFPVTQIFRRLTLLVAIAFFLFFILPLLLFIFVIVAMLYYVITQMYYRQRFRLILNGLSKNENMERLRNTFNVLNYRIIDSGEDFIRAKTAISALNWGEYITAVPTDHKVLINSCPVKSSLLSIESENIKMIEKVIGREEEYNL